VRHLWIRSGGEGECGINGLDPGGEGGVRHLWIKSGGGGVRHQWIRSRSGEGGGR
jgi:hypothetical protein